jgi:peptidoglycan/LPS O-acetylase OafA/YrhL
MLGTNVLDREGDGLDVTRPTRQDLRRPPARGKRADIQALRALAVGLVVVYHFWPHRLPGGFVGVDVFFAISGFLIISHLVEEHRRTGRIALARFWARRARRLLPASLLVLSVSAVGVVALLPGAQWLQAFREIIASALYVQNWALASDSVDYLAAENLPSPVQHFWSLSAEEQFYIAVPLLMAAAAFVRGRAAMLAILVSITAASLAYSVHLTATAPGPAYFVTPTRAWEFAAGGLLAFVPGAVGMVRLRAAAAWAGWVGIVLTGLLYTSELPFPGYTAALPVVATLLVIWAAGPAVRWAPDRLLAHRASTFLGDVSYSIYLWHWPVLIFTGTLLGADFTWPGKLVALCAVVVLARLTWQFVENPVQRSRTLVTRPARVTFVAVAAAMAVVIGPLTVGSVELRQAAADEIAAAEAAADQAAECFGGTWRSGDCADVVFDELTPDPAVAGEDKDAGYEDGCHVSNVGPDVRACHHGDPDGALRVAVVGDSHARSWVPTLRLLAEARGWSLTTYTKAACPQSTATRHNEDAAIQESCASWNAALRDDIEAVQPYDVVLVSHFAAGEGYESRQASIEGFRSAWRMFTDRGAEVVVIRDNPRATEETLACLESSETEPDRCARPLEEALPEYDLMVEAADGRPSVHVVDLTDQFCWDGVCHAAIGGVTVYRDPHHVTRTFAATLAPALAAELERLGLV